MSQMSFLHSHTNVPELLYHTVILFTISHCSVQYLASRFSTERLHKHSDLREGGPSLVMPSYTVLIIAYKEPNLHPSSSPAAGNECVE